jgi:single-strand DNA-binding protein
LIEGRLRLDQWDDKQTGQKKSKLGVVAETVQFLGGAPAGGEGGAPAAPAPPRASRPAAPASAPAPESGDSEPPHDDDVPF